MNLRDIAFALFWAACCGALFANISIWTLLYMQSRDWLTIKLWPAMVLSYLFWQLLTVALGWYATTNGWVVTLAPLWKIVAQVFFYALFFHVTWPKIKDVETQTGTV